MGECTPFKSCSNSTVFSDGSSHINVRFNVELETDACHYLEMCCDPEDIVEDHFINIPVPHIPVENQDGEVATFPSYDYNLDGTTNKPSAHLATHPTQRSLGHESSTFSQFGNNNNDINDRDGNNDEYPGFDTSRTTQKTETYQNQHTSGPEFQSASVSNFLLSIEFKLSLFVIYAFTYRHATLAHTIAFLSFIARKSFRLTPFKNPAKSTHKFVAIETEILLI